MYVKGEMGCQSVVRIILLQFRGKEIISDTSKGQEVVGKAGMNSTADTEQESAGLRID